MRACEEVQGTFALTIDGRSRSGATLPEATGAGSATPRTRSTPAMEASVFSLEGDSGSPGFVKNPDGTVSAVGILTSSPENDDYTTYFILVHPLLAQWGLRILP